MGTLSEPEFTFGHEGVSHATFPAAHLGPDFLYFVSDCPSSAFIWDRSNVAECRSWRRGRSDLLRHVLLGSNRPNVLACHRSRISKGSARSAGTARDPRGREGLFHERGLLLVLAWTTRADEGLPPSRIDRLHHDQRQVAVGSHVVAALQRNVVQGTQPLEPAEARLDGLPLSVQGFPLDMEPKPSTATAWAPTRAI